MLAEPQTGDGKIPVNRRDATFILQSIFLLLSNNLYYDIYLLLAKVFFEAEDGGRKRGISCRSCIKLQRRSI